jgi:uncharacterized membrane protein YozB (DUF420 family)
LIIGGEVTALDENGRSSFQPLQSYGLHKEIPLVYYAFNRFSLDGTDLRSRAFALVAGFVFIRTKRIKAHRTAMFVAFVFSTLFLVSYITNHALHGDMRFHGQGLIRPVYFDLLISHIGLSVLALPLILITFFLSLSGRFPAHRRLARWTFPIWLYVSVTGVAVYAMLAAYR